MKTKLTTLLFGLLLAVGWTSSSYAQALPRHKVATNAASMSNTSLLKEEIGRPAGITPNAMDQGQQLRAPQRSQNFSATSPVTHPKSWYQALPDVTWNGGSQNITEPFTDVDGMIALLTRIYTDRNIPGFKYSENRQNDIPYQSIEYGWNINGTNYNDDIQLEAHPYAAIYGIEFYDANNNPLASWSAYDSGTTFPSSWTTTGGVGSYYGVPYLQVSNGYYGQLTIPASYIRSLNNTTPYLRVSFYTFNYRSSSTNAEFYLGSSTYPGLYTHDTAPYSEDTAYGFNYYLPGTVTPPDDAGYTVMLVKLQDDFDSNVPEYTSSRDELRDFFTEYIKEIDLLTDGLRVNENTADAGTLFAYTGDLNKFYFIGKGKLAYGKSLEAWPFDRAPFYSMYEEFSPYVAGGTEDHSDLYEKMRQGATYPVVHDCEGVIYMKHWFTIASEDGSTENRVNSLVFYVPDNRGISTEWQNYDPDHQPTVGMYMIDLYADIEPSTTPDYYTATVNWFDNLDVITHSEGIPQTYNLYQIMYNEQTGQNDTTLIYTGPNTTWSGDYPVGENGAYDIHYFVVGTPTAATNPDTFFAQSNTDDVTVPGKNDFIGLQWIRYESDYVTKNEYDADNNEVNYYRNWLAPHKLSTQGQSGISAGNVGTTGRTLTLYRDDTPVIDLELVMNGNKAYYRIKYINRNENQKVEHGYDPNTGEKTSTNN